VKVVSWDKFFLYIYCNCSDLTR